MSDDHYIRFELTGELALAGFFLMSHWPNPDTIPQLQPSVASLGFVVDTRGSCLNELKQTLQSIARCHCSLGASDGSLLESAEAWSKEIDRLQPAGDVQQAGWRRSQKGLST